MHKSVLYFLFALLVSFFNLDTALYATPPTDNDECTNATSLTLGITNTAGTVKGMSQSAGIPVGCATGTPDDDVWYKFTLSSSQSVSVLLSSIGTNLSSSGAVLQLFSGACGSLSSITCGNTEIIATDLAAGNYYVRVYSYGSTGLNSNADFNITVNGAPSNNECSGAVSLTSNTSCSPNTSGTLKLASVSSDVPVGCASAGNHYDVWYSFVAASAISQTITLSGRGSNFSSPEMQLFSGSCGSLTSIQCGTTSLTASGLTVGTTYYVRVSNVGTNPSGTGVNSDFSICVTHPAQPPSNDECSGATTLTIGTANTSGTVWNATTSSVPAGCASGTPDDDVWYKFSATSTNATVSLSSLGSNLSAAGAMVQLFSGSCASFTPVACGYNSLSASGLTNGTTYYVRVYSSASGSIGGVASGSAFSITVSNPSTPVVSSSVGLSRMNEVFQQTILSPANVLNDPWEIAYGPDGYLWITEAKGYKVYRMNPTTGLKTTVLDVSQNSAFLPSSDQSFNVQFSSGMSPWPQGGFAGLVIHPKFLDATSPKNFVYVSYVHTYISGTSSSTSGVFFTNRIVRFTYNTTTGMLESPVSLCDTLPGSSDHNSQRMIIAPVSGTNYLFYAAGDMGSGQFTNLTRTLKSQISSAYEGKILRFNLEEDTDGGVLDKWIPNDNPFNTTTQSAVWSTGIRNNQGFAYGNVNGTERLYGSSHGPYSDDEINIIEKAKNYGHPLVVGYSSDGNYDGAAVGPSNGSAPLIASEAANATSIGSSYKDPIYTFYSAPKGNTSTPNTIQYIWTYNPANSGWPSEAPSGMDIYTNSVVPGWKNSLILGLLKGGKIMRLKLSTDGSAIAPTAGSDTVSYFRSVNRFRDIALSPDGRSVFTIIDKSSTTSGPTTGSPMVSACAGCLIKYSFLGYNHNTSTNKSDIPTSIEIAAGKPDVFQTGNKVVINAANGNNNLWVPITDTSSNIIAEINARGNDLDTIITTLFTRTGNSRVSNAKKYLNRNLTITPQKQPSSPVWIRLYIAKTELDAFKADDGVAGVSNLKIIKNEDSATTAIASNTSLVNTIIAESFGSNGYVLQGEISSFSSFYFAPSFITLPLQLSNFRGSLRNEATLLQWETTNEVNTSHFVIERSINGQNFDPIGSVNALGNSDKNNYSYLDKDAKDQGARVLYYRLRMIDQDNQYKYSDVISVVFNSSSTVTIYPNPIDEEINLNVVLVKAEQIQITITDIQGHLIYKQTKQLSAGANLLKVNTKTWPSQTYTVQVVGSDKKPLITKKVVKL